MVVAHILKVWPQCYSIVNSHMMINSDKKTTTLFEVLNSLKGTNLVLSVKELGQEVLGLRLDVLTEQVVAHVVRVVEGVTNGVHVLNSEKLWVSSSH